MITAFNNIVDERAHKNGHTAPATAETTGNATQNTQVSARPTRRRFTNAYKRRILQEADICNKPGELGALLRREGLYSSTLQNFRKQQAEGKLIDRSPELLKKQRQQKEAKRQRDARRLAQLEAENHKLRVLLELQKKVADLLDIPLNTLPSE